MSNGHFIRVLRRREVVTLSFGAMVGWSWVVLTGQWIQSAGSLGAIGAFLAGGIAIIFIGLTYSELAAAMPKAGGEHVYSLRALGHGGSFVCTWAIVFAYVAVVAFEAVALPTVLDYLAPQIKFGYLWTVVGWDVYATSVAIGMTGAIVMTAINVIGVKPSAVLQTAVTVLLLVVGVLFISGALFKGEMQNVSPLFVDGFKGFAAVLIMVPAMLVGFDVVPQAAEEVDIPYRSIGAMLMFSVFMAVAWYALIVLGVSLILDNPAMAGSTLVTASANEAVWSSVWGGRVLVLAGIGGILSSWNAFLVGGSRAVYALAHSGMLPRSLGVLHRRFNTPYRAVILIGTLSFFAPLFGRQTLVWLIDASSLAIVIAYGMVAVSFLVLRRREPDMNRPFKVRHGELFGTMAVILSLALCGLYLPGSPSALVWPYEWGLFLAWWILGPILYVWSRRR